MEECKPLVAGDDAIDELNAQLEAVDEELETERERAAEVENALDAARLKLTAAMEKAGEREYMLEVRITQLEQQLAAAAAAAAAAANSAKARPCRLNR